MPNYPTKTIANQNQTPTNQNQNQNPAIHKKGPKPQKQTKFTSKSELSHHNIQNPHPKHHKKERKRKRKRKKELLTKQSSSMV